MPSLSKLKKSMWEQINICVQVQEKAITEEISEFTSRIFYRFKSAVVSEYLRTLKIMKLQTVQPKHAWHRAAKQSLCLALPINWLMQQLLWDFAFNFCLDNDEEHRVNDLCPVSLQSALFALCGYFSWFFAAAQKC